MDLGDGLFISAGFCGSLQPVTVSKASVTIVTLLARRFAIAHPSEGIRWDYSRGLRETEHLPRVKLSSLQRLKADSKKVILRCSALTSVTIISALPPPFITYRAVSCRLLTARAASTTVAPSMPRAMLIILLILLFDLVTIATFLADLLTIIQSIPEDHARITTQSGEPENSFCG